MKKKPDISSTMQTQRFPAASQALNELRATVTDAPELIRFLRLMPVGNLKTKRDRLLDALETLVKE